MKSIKCYTEHTFDYITRYTGEYTKKILTKEK